MKHTKLFEDFINESSTWEKVSAKSKEMFGEWVIDVLREEDMAQLFDMKEADKLAKKIFGEFGFATLDLDDMRILVDKYPKIVKIKL
jgi:putative heme iron utilization protein